MLFTSLSHSRVHGRNHDSLIITFIVFGVAHGHHEPSYCPLSFFVLLAIYYSFAVSPLLPFRGATAIIIIPRCECQLIRAQHLLCRQEYVWRINVLSTRSVLTQLHVLKLGLPWSPNSLLLLRGIMLQRPTLAETGHTLSTVHRRCGGGVRQRKPRKIAETFRHPPP